MRKKLLLVLFIGVLMAALDIAIIGPALPTIQDAFSVSDRAIPWLFTMYVLMNLIGTPLMAKLSDLFGRRSVYTADVALFAAGSLIIVFSPSFAVVLLGRAIQGLGAGGIFPVASAVIGDTFPAEERGRALGLIGAVFGLAFLIGPIIGGVLLLWSWRLIFAINLPIALIVIAAGWRLLPQTRPDEQRPFDLAGMIVLGILLAGLAYGLNQIDATQFVNSVVSLQVWPFILLGLVLIPIFWHIEHRAADPIIRPSLLGTQQLKLASALSFGAGLGEVGVLFLPALAVAAFSVSESRASFMLMPLVLALSVGAPAAGRLLDAVGSKLVVLGGTVLLAAGMVGLSIWPDTLVGYYGASILIGLGLSALLGAPIRYIMINEAPVQDRGAAQAVITVFTSIGQLVSAALVGAVAESAGGGVSGYGHAYLVIGVVAVVLIALSLGLKNHADEMATVEEHESERDAVLGASVQ